MEAVLQAELGSYESRRASQADRHRSVPAAARLAPGRQWGWRDSTDTLWAPQQRGGHRPARHRPHLAILLPLSFSSSRSWQEKPKSVSLMFMSSSRRMFSGFRSRWTMLMEWRYWITSSSARMIFLGMGDSTSPNLNTHWHRAPGDGDKDRGRAAQPPSLSAGAQPGVLVCPWVPCRLQGHPSNPRPAFAT